MKHFILCLLTIALGTSGCASAPSQKAAPRTNSEDIALEGVVESFRRNAQHMTLQSGVGVSFDVAKVKITRPASLAGGVMNVTYRDIDRSFWESDLPKRVAFEMSKDGYAMLVEVLKDDRQINSFPSLMLKRIKPSVVSRN